MTYKKGIITDIDLQFSIPQLPLSDELTHLEDMEILNPVQDDVLKNVIADIDPQSP